MKDLCVRGPSFLSEVVYNFDSVSAYFSECSQNFHMLKIRDLFHVLLIKFEFHFSRLHVNKINNFCFLLDNRRVPCMNK